MFAQKFGYHHFQKIATSSQKALFVKSSAKLFHCRGKDFSFGIKQCGKGLRKFPSIQIVDYLESFSTKLSDYSFIIISCH